MDACCVALTLPLVKVILLDVCVEELSEIFMYVHKTVVQSTGVESVKKYVTGNCSSYVCTSCLARPVLGLVVLPQQED